MTSSFLRALATVLLLASAAALFAQPLVKPLPQPDLSRLPAAARAELETQRRDFDAVRPDLVGPPLADAYALIAARYARYGVLDVALAALDNAIALQPDDGRYHYLRGVVLVQQRNLAAAKAAFEAALARDPDHLPIRYRLADVALSTDDLATARRAVSEVATRRPELAPAHALLGEVFMREKRYAEAIAAYRRALAADPQASALRGALAQALEASGDAAGAKRERALEGPRPPAFADPLVEGIISPGGGDPASQALAAAAQGQHAQARELLDAALKTTPNDVALRTTAARIEADAGAREAAMRHARAALTAAPGNARAELTMGVVLESAGEADAAVPHYEAAVRADPELAEARMRLGHAHQRRREPARAIEHYRAWARLEPAVGETHAHLAAAQFSAGRCREGLAEVDGALRRRPKDGGLLQVFVRMVASCPQATAAERDMALDYAQSLYRARPDLAHAEALAMLMAARGKFDEALEYQRQAMFEAAKTNDQAQIARMRPELERYRRRERTLSPWPAGHPFLAPPPLAPAKPAA